VVPYRYWLQRGLRPDVVGESITLNGHRFTVIGVAPEGFNGTMPVMSSDLWLPFGAASLVEMRGAVGPSASVVNDRAGQTLLLGGTLKPGLTAAGAESQLTTLAAALERAYPEYNRDQRLTVQRRSRVNRGPNPGSDSGPAALAVVLMAIAGLVLLVACLNLANICLARGSVRQPEIAIRLALGSDRFRIVRQLFVEGLLLSALAGAAALLMAWWASTSLLSSLSTALPVQIFLSASPDGRVVTAIALACVLSTSVFALFPAWTMSRPDLVATLKQSPTAPFKGRRRFSVPVVLVGTQLALSLALLITAGMFLRAATRAVTTEPGFPLTGGLLAEIDLGLTGADEREGRNTYAKLLDGIRALPNVRAASAASIVPLGQIRIAHRVMYGEATTSATYTVIGADYFSALDLPIVAGREFLESEERDPSAEPVAIVDQTLTERLFPGESPLGQFIQVSMSDQPGEPLRIVGVVGAVRDDILEPPSAHVYVAQGRNYTSQMTFHVRTAAGLESEMLETVRQAIRQVNAQVPIVSLKTLTDHRDNSASVWAVFLAAQLFGAFGAIALALATAGVYGLRAYLVARRTREIGIRLALGATRTGIVKQLLRESALVSVVGLLAGSLLAVGVIVVLRSSGMLFQVSSTDPLVLTLAPLVLASTTALASYLPARRAMRIDPALTLRSE
jgi:predicted permease